MRQQSQKFSLKEEQKQNRLPSTNTTTAKQSHQFQDQTLIQQVPQSSSQKQHDPQTQMIYDLMNFQNKPISNPSRQLNLKIPITQKHHIGNPKLPSQTHQGNLFNQQTLNSNQDELSPPVNVPQASQTSNTGQFFRQAALNTLQKDQTKLSNDADQQVGPQQNTLLSTGFDLSEKSTTAATAFPHLSTKSSTFHRKRPSLPFGEVTAQQPTSSNQPSNLNMPTIQATQMNLQGQKIRGFTKMGRRYNAVNYQQQDSVVNDSSSLQRGNFHAEIVGGHSQPVNSKNNQRQSLERNKIQHALIQPQNQPQLQSATQILPQNHLINFQPSLQISQQHSEELTSQQNISPSSTLQLQRRLQANGAENPHLNFNKIGNQIQQSFQQVLSSQISNNHNINSNDSQDNAMTIRDIKIRKVHPQQKIQKSNLRFQTAQLILDSSAGNNQNTTRQNPLSKKQDTTTVLSHLPLLPLQHLQGTSTFDSRVHDQEDSNQVSDNEPSRDMMSRRRSDTEKELIIYKTLNLEERKRLIKHHHKMRRYNEQEQNSSANESGILDKSSSVIRNASQDPNDVLQDANEYLNLDTIEEETNNNEEVKSQVSKLLGVKEVSKSIQTVSSGRRAPENKIDSNQFLPLIISNQANSSTQNSPIISKFKRALQTSEPFNIIYKKIKEGAIAKGEEEYKHLLEGMCQISGLTVEETEKCIDHMQRIEFKEKFHNPYFKQSVSSQDSIEENIASISLNHSFSLVNVGFNVGSGYSRQPSNSGSSNWTQQYGQQHQPYTAAGGSNQHMKNRVSVGDSIGNFSGQSKLIAIDTRSNGQTSEHRSQISKKSSGQQVKSEQGSSNSTSGPKKGKSVRDSQKNPSLGSHNSNDHKGLNIIGSNGGGSSDSQKVSNEIGKSPLIEKISKPQARHEFYAEPRKPGLTLEMLKQSRGQSIQPQFNDILSGVKAPLAEKNVNQVYGNLIKWREGKKIGQGTSGEVYLAQNVKTFHIFVVKKLNLFTASSGVDKESVLKLKKEIEVYRKLDNENVVKYIGSEIVNNQFCIYLEYLSGGSICSIYQSFGKLPEQTIKVYTKQILKGLIYLHQNKVVHCDLKGANVLVDQTGVVKLTDFGCSKLFESSFSQSDFSGVIRGSLAWMAPEVLLNKGIRRKADIWSLGCLVIEMAVAGNPWGNEIVDNYFQAMLKVADPTKFPAIPTELSEGCQDFIVKCLTRDYEQRPTSLELWSHPWIQSSL